MIGRAAILIANGFDRSGRYAAPLAEETARRRGWIQLCLSQIERYSRLADPEVLVFDNANWPDQQTRIRSYARVRLFPAERELTHPEALDFLVGKTGPETEYIITLDSDCFPIRDGWIEQLTAKLDSGYALAGIWRDEMLPYAPAFIHPSCMAIRREDLLGLGDVSFARRANVDLGFNITQWFTERGREFCKLRRSNRTNLHFLLGGIYGDLLYHQGAGSRLPKFWKPSDPIADLFARGVLEAAAFADIDRLVSYLQGANDALLDQLASSLLEVPRSAIPITEAGSRRAGPSSSGDPAPGGLRGLIDPKLDPVFWPPEPRAICSAWSGHVPFAHWLIGATAPRLFVELGTNRGGSYTAFCSAVVRHQTNTRCFAVDTWRGDKHTGAYGEGVFRSLQEFHDSHYARFSELMRCTFSDALSHFSDGSIDLLHIDGYHTYDSVARDFQSWLPKLSARGVVLLHDTNERQGDFGVWKLWESVKSHYPSFEFLHSHGLGVIATGSEAPEAILALCNLTDATEIAAVRERFALLGTHWVVQAEAETLSASREATLLKFDIVRRERDALLRSTSWRSTRPLRAMARYVPLTPRRSAVRIAERAWRTTKRVTR